MLFMCFMGFGVVVVGVGLVKFVDIMNVNVDEFLLEISVDVLRLFSNGVFIGFVGGLGVVFFVLLILCYVIEVGMLIGDSVWEGKMI